MIVFVGLGNPGSKYADTKHNAGYWVVDELSRRRKLAFKPGKGDYLFSRSNDGNVLMVKPTTGMNGSGTAVKDVMNHFNVFSEDMIVIVDDVDLPLGQLRIRPKGGDGCHRGLESIIYTIGTTHFPRLRYGIATEENTRPAERYVLKPFRKSDHSIAHEMVQTAADAAESILVNGIAKTMNHFNVNPNKAQAEDTKEKE